MAATMMPHADSPLETVDEPVLSRITGLRSPGGRRWNWVEVVLTPTRLLVMTQRVMGSGQKIIPLTSITAVSEQTAYAPTEAAPLPAYRVVSIRVTGREPMKLYADGGSRQEKALATLVRTMSHLFSKPLVYIEKQYSK